MLTDKEMERIGNKRRAYYVPEIPNGGDLDYGTPGHYYPGISVEGESGYFVTDWDWGTDRALAQQCADEKNARLGLTKQDAERIILSSMFAKKGGR
jgi:hypothetical protein